MARALRKSKRFFGETPQEPCGRPWASSEPGGDLREAEPPKSASEGSLEPIVGLSHRQEHPANQGHPTQQSLLCRNSGSAV